MSSSSNAVTAFVSLTLLAGAAHAGLSTSVLTLAESFYAFQSPGTTNAYMNVDDEPAANATFNLPWKLDSSTHSMIDSWNSSFSGGVMTSEDSVIIDASSSVQGMLNEPASLGGNLAQTRNEFLTLVTIQVSDEVDATIAFDGFASMANTALSRSELEITVTSAMGSFNDFTAGFNTGTTIEGPFAFNTTLQAGDEIEILFDFDLLVSEDVDPRVMFEQGLNGTFSVTVPAPQSLAVLGLGGLMASRRLR